MKIDAYNAGLIQGQGTERTESTSAATVRHADPAANDAADHVHLSTDVQLLQAATAAAEQAPEVRQELVARARAALDAGQIGNDAGRLADALIDAWIQTP